MKVLALQGSPNLKGNTATLLDAWLLGVKESGVHHIDRLDVTRLNIKPCIGCNYCRPGGKSTGVCVQKDEMPYNLVQEADIIVFASPIYWWGLTAQIKAVMDRMYALPFKIWRTKKVKFVFSLTHPVPSMAKEVFDRIWDYEKDLLHCGYLGVLEGSDAKMPLSQQPELLAGARAQGLADMRA